MLHETAAAILAAAADEGDAVAGALTRGRARLTDLGYGRVEYLDLVDAETLAPLDRAPVPGRPARLLVAARLGSTRLIDNIPVETRTTA